MTTLPTDRLGDWGALPFFTDGLQDVERHLSADTRTILPAPNPVFAALEMCQARDTKVVILGQDPYPTAGHAHGLAFSAEPHVLPLPRSLGNIYKEMDTDLGARPTTPDLRHWARQGVLLLNTALTVPEGDAGGHMKIGWQTLTHQILQTLSDTPRAFLLWGKPAQKLGQKITGNGHFMLETAHPSPLSARRGFFGSRPFSKVNSWLEDHEMTPINWVQET
jgi:uracil-DNA glycosylase